MSKAESTYLLKDKVAIITGAGRGIGQATALKMAEEGASVVLAARTSYLLEEVANDIVDSGGKALPLPTDISSQDQIESMVAETLKTFGRIDVLVNNAAVGGAEGAIDSGMP